MEQNAYQKLLTLMSAKDIADPLLNSIKNELDNAVNMFENDKDWGAAVAIGKAQVAMTQFMELWKEISS